jgi:hypothetical protein
MLQSIVNKIYLYAVQDSIDCRSYYKKCVESTELTCDIPLATALLKHYEYQVRKPLKQKI